MNKNKLYIIYNTFVLYNIIIKLNLHFNFKILNSLGRLVYPKLKLNCFFLPRSNRTHSNTLKDTPQINQPIMVTAYTNRNTPSPVFASM